MTEPEIKQLVANLTRVWKIKRPHWSVTKGRAQFGQHLHLYGRIAKDIRFSYDPYYSKDDCFLGLQLRFAREWENIASCQFKTGDIRFFQHESEDEEKQALASRHRETFRRNCWLSGCHIECTQHEQLEWTLWLKEQEANDEEN